MHLSLFRVAPVRLVLQNDLLRADFGSNESEIGYVGVVKSAVDGPSGEVHFAEQFRLQPAASVGTVDRGETLLQT